MIVMPKGRFCLPLQSTSWLQWTGVGTRPARSRRIAPRQGRCRMPGNLSVSELNAAIAAGDIDTVIVAFADAQGRLVGKRVSARLFQEEVLSHGAEACNYLLSVDVDMNTVDGYAMSSWDKGYGDMMLLPDAATLRKVPWQPGSALVMADLGWENGDPVVQSPRDILKRQRLRLADRG